MNIQIQIEATAKLIASTFNRKAQMDEQRLNIKQFIAEMWIHWVVALRYSVSLRINRILSNAISNIVLFFLSFSLTFMCTSFLFYTFIIRFRDLIFRPAPISNKFGQITANIFIFFFSIFLCELYAQHIAQLCPLMREKKKHNKNWAKKMNALRLVSLVKQKLFMWWTFCRTIEVVNCISWLWSIGCPK